MVIARLQLGGVRRAVNKLAAESAAPAPCRQCFVSSGRAEHDFVAEMRSAYLQSDGKARPCPARRAASAIGWNERRESCRCVLVPNQRLFTVKVPEANMDNAISRHLLRAEDRANA
jgi:hypothetical protein